METGKVYLMPTPRGTRDIPPERGIVWTRMHGELSDPQGPKKWRMLPYLLPTVMLLFAIFGPLSAAPATFLGLGSFAVWNLLGLLPWRQGKSRKVAFECGPGYVDIKNAGTRNQRIRAKDIVGATTARTAEGVVVTLQHKKRDQPVTILVENEGQAEKIRHALGIGHGGFGAITWRTLADNTMRAAFVGRILAVLMATIVLALGIFGEETAALIAGIFLGQFAAVGALLGLVGLLGRSSEPSIIMAPEGLRLRTPRGWFALPYDAVQHLFLHDRGFVFAIPPPYGQISVEKSSTLVGGLGTRDREILLAQVNAATARAHGLGPRKVDVTGRLDVLRRNGASVRDWLVRLDMQGQMLQTAPGYRGNTLDAEDLWAILEDPEAESELRAAAARILRHVPQPEARARIDAAVAAVRDESTNKRLRIAIEDDVDHASNELAHLEAMEPRPSQPAMYMR